MSASAPLELAIFISGRGSNMLAIAQACQQGRIPAHLALVLSDRADAGGLASATQLGIRTAVVPGGASGDSPLFEARIAEELESSGAQAIALAGFMRILSGAFVAHWLGRIFNIHPSLLPAYRGLHTHRRVLSAGDGVHGASVHFVTAELDGGPVILQSRLAVAPGVDEATLMERVLATEHVIYPRALGWFAQRRLEWRDGAAWLDSQRLYAPIVEDFNVTGTTST
jgi:phosphoribosylglycinamide formyltransferase 1